MNDTALEMGIWGQVRNWDKEMIRIDNGDLWVDQSHRDGNGRWG